MPEKQGSGVRGQGSGRCRIRGCSVERDPGCELCFAHRLEQDAAREAEQKEMAVQIEEDFRLTFGTESGERSLAYLASAFFLGDTTLRVIEGGGIIDPLEMAFNEGSRFVVLRILALTGRLNLKYLEDLWRKK